MSRRLRTIARFMSQPVVGDLPVLVSFMALTFVTPAIFIASLEGRGVTMPVGETTLWVASSLLLAYFSTLIYSVFHNRAVVISLYVILGLGALIDIICYVSMGGIYGAWIVEQVLGTNFGEASEFLFEKTSPKPVVYICATTLASAAGYFLVKIFVKPRWRCNRVYRLVAALLVVASAVITVVGFCENPGSAFVRTGYVFKLFNLTDIRPVPDIVPANPAISPTSATRPANVVVVIGESMNRTHCHYDGYPLPTTPNIERMHADSLLWLFNDVDAADFHTIQCFKRFMSTNNSTDADAPWNTSPNIIEVARLAGYRTIWLSTQSRAGVYDNVVSKFGHFCDVKKWLRGETLSDSRRNILDGELLPCIVGFLNDGHDGNNMFFIHLMGSHPNFRFRYPEEFAHFTADDYPHRLPAQRATMAHYDNSILYTDSVLADMMHAFDGTPAVVIYFSDHGLDVYDSAPDFCEHAKPGVEASERVCRAIPFMIYTTPEFKRDFPMTTRRIIDAQPRHYDCGDLIYTVMDIINVTFDDSPDAVPAHSLLGQ